MMPSRVSTFKIICFTIFFSGAGLSAATGIQCRVQVTKAFDDVPTSTFTRAPDHLKISDNRKPSARWLPKDRKPIEPRATEKDALQKIIRKAKLYHLGTASIFRKLETTPSMDSFSRVPDATTVEF